MDRLRRKALLGLGQLLLMLLLGLFLPAGTIRYWEGWLYLAVFFGSSAAVTAYLAKRDPGSLSRRLEGGPAAEEDPRQKVIQVVASIGFLAILVVSALDYRFDWSAVPTWVVIVGEVLVLVGFYVIFATFRENSYASATIRTSEEQTVVSTGPYAIVRHPMYAGALVMLAGTPLALGSYWGLLVLVPMLMAIVWRLLTEEQFLTHELAGYAEYKTQVRHRLIPAVW